MRILVASTNPVKLEAVRHGFQRMFPSDEIEIVSGKAASGVSDQPATDKETLTGAINRAHKTRELFPGYAFWVGVEGGVEDDGKDLSAFAWIVVLSDDAMGKGRTGTFYLPPAVAILVRQGKELGDADDIVFNKRNSKQANGAIGLLTDNVLTRATFYEQAVILALVRFKNPELYAND